MNTFDALIDAHTNLAVMFVQMDEFDKAFENCKLALKYRPDDHNALVNFTDILRQLGKKEQAI